MIDLLLLLVGLLYAIAATRISYLLIVTIYEIIVEGKSDEKSTPREGD